MLNKVSTTLLNNSVEDVATLIVDTLNLEISPEEINPQQPLFGSDGLGLDSIDALELALALSKKYGLELKSDDAQRFNIFANLASLAQYVNENKTQ